ncbi:wax ester/triacylglycerol synthase family O-acyltransferase [Nocardia vaccinii]|uniref:wax ester/triacylglycerol synthase family O-acyltransferase n=1 Tax=Nocardia vaccinii TaxID=1822 RepID=UPI000A00216F|nr:wax ester/triacylglycerol synthase family O-acyltransferase [Nocardia vaccinii]
MAELGPLDAGFLAMEDSDRHVSMGIGTVSILHDPPPTPAELRAWIDRGLESHGRLRQRVRRTPLDLKAPVWEDDPNFDLEHHIRWTALPDPGGEQELRELVATELTERLDRDHPMWEVVVVEHLADERWALITKAHHTVIDGISGVTLFESFCDPIPDGRPAGTAKPSHIGPARLLSGVLRLPYTVPRVALGTVRTLAPVLLAAVTPVAETSLNGPIGRQRRYAVARTELPHVREIGAAYGVTVNDVAVAAIAAAYRGLLLRRGEHPAAGTLRIVVPVSMRKPDAKYVLDNRVSAMVPYLPIEVVDPVERLLAAHQRIARHRTRGEPEAEQSLLRLAGWLPSGLVGMVFRLASWFPQRGVSALATNIPGPRHRLRLGGRDVLEMWPCIPIAMRVRTTIAILSYGDVLTFGITGDRDTAPDIDAIASGIATEVAVLLAHARGQRPRRRMELVRDHAARKSRGSATDRSSTRSAGGSPS